MIQIRILGILRRLFATQTLIHQQHGCNNQRNDYHNHDCDCGVFFAAGLIASVSTVLTGDGCAG